MKKNLLALALAGLTANSAFSQKSYSLFSGEEGTADFLKPRPFGYNEKPWGKRNRRKLGGMKGGQR